MIDALIAGRLYGKPQARTSKTGSEFATAKVRTPMANGESAFINVVAFSQSAKDALLALDEGDSVAIAGELKVSIYTDKSGQAKPSLDLTAYVVTTEYHVSRKRKAVRDEPAGVAAPDHSRDQDIPF
jgi:single-stranded DNA-binding protein